MVAIIAILAAIAIPNYLSAQTRSKVSRVNADQRSIACGLECYLVDNNTYPYSCLCGCITTPVSYMTKLPKDPFHDIGREDYMFAKCARMQAFCINSYGPDGTTKWNPYDWRCGMPSTYPLNYDPTNGVISNGDVYRNTKGG